MPHGAYSAVTLGVAMGMTPYLSTIVRTMFVDLHTHKRQSDSPHTISILNLSPEEGWDTYCHPCSVGIHPWHSNNVTAEVLERLHLAAKANNVRMIGETGVDKMRGDASLEQQTQVFLLHAEIAENARKPLIIHCVKAFDTLIAARRSFHPTQTWIIHGFRGKPQQAQQLIDQGFHLSFGAHYNELSLIKAMERKCAWLETDENTASIEDVYSSAAATLNMPLERLKADILERFIRTTGKRECTTGKRECTTGKRECQNVF